jgi:hypothetical protein
MAKFARTKDERGKRYGHLLVLFPEKVRGNRESYWRVRCVCGKEKSVRGSHLRDGSSTSCGCLARNPYPLKDERGKRYGHLLVLSSEVQHGRRGHWLCRCDCGKETVVRGAHLRNGQSTNCGCLSKRGRHYTGPVRRQEKAKEVYFANADMTERILAWQREDEPDRLLAILDKFDPLIKRLIARHAGGNFLDRRELASDIYVAIWAACRRFVPGYSVYSYFYTVIYYALVKYKNKYREERTIFLSLEAPLAEGEEITLYDILPASALLTAA